MTVKEYLIDRLIEFDPTLDLSDNSALVDLLVNPGAAMLDPVVAQLNFLLANLGLGDPELINEAELDAIAGNFLKVRKPGAKAVGVVELFYNNPIDLDIPEGTSFTSSAGVTFVTDRNIHVPLSSMAGNTWNFPRYSSGTIPVVATDYGVIASIPPNDIISTDLIPAPSSVTNPSAFSGGADKETNTEFAARIIDEVIVGSLGSAEGIRANLSPTFPTIQEIKVRGMNDIEMLRDLVYSGLQVYANYKSVDYYGKVSGLNEMPFPQSLAYWNVFYDDPTTSGLIDDLPASAEFTNQFTTEQYGGIYDPNDVLKTAISTNVVLSDDFQSPTLNSAWKLSDSTLDVGVLKDVEEVALVTLSGSQMLRLGHRLTSVVVDAMSRVNMNMSQVLSIMNHMLELAKSGSVASDIDYFTEYADLYAYYQEQLTNHNRTVLQQALFEISEKARLEKTQNLYPVMTRTLSKHAGIIITGRFQTDDTSDEGKLSYVTVLRDEDSIDPTNGYGFAWMKNDATNSIFNVYLVDNSPLANDLFISPTSVVLSQGENPFKAAAKVDIQPNILYQFKLEIGADYSMNLRIWPDAGTEPALPQLNTGAPSTVAANGTHIGFGVMGTENGQWYYDNLLVQNNVGVHTALLYRLKADPAYFPNGTWARVNHYGYGWDGTTWGLSMFVKRYVNGAWTWVAAGTNLCTDISDREITRVSYEFYIDTDYRDTDNFVDVLVTSTDAANAVTEVGSYYINLENAIAAGIHTGGCADIYINDPPSILTAEQTLNNVTGNIIMDSSNGFLGPIHSIVGVQTAMIGDSLAENSDWALTTPNAATAYSTQEYPYLTFSTALVDTKVKVIYRYYVYGQAIQDQLESDKYRYSGASNLGKIMPPIIIRVNDLRYRGALTVTEAQTAIADYVNSQLLKVTRSDIVNCLYTAGASFVDTTNLDIEYIINNYKRETFDPIQLTNEYEKPDLSAFYTDPYELNGVTKL